jgi:predicted NBD/HSP70 family sugar kinase
MANQSLVRHVNERRILTLLRLEGASTRADIARRLSLTRSTITNLMDGLLARSLVREMTTSANRAPGELGRPGIDVSLNPSGAYFLGVEIDVGTVNFAILDLAGKVAETKAVRGRLDGPQDAIRHVAAFLDSVGRRRQFRDQIQAIGMTVPGLVRSDGLVVHLPVLGWKNVSLQQLAARKFDIPTFVENNTNAAAFGEIYTLPRQDHDCIVYLKLGIGCGGAAIINGRLLRGSTGTATEFGHIRLRENGPLCSCGRRGCLESFVNLAALGREYAPKTKFNDEQLAELPSKLVAAAAVGDRKARDALDIVGKNLATGLISLTNIFNPSEVVLGGIARPLIVDQLDRVKRDVRNGVVPGMEVPRLTLSSSGEFECAIGAAAIAHYESFDVSTIELGGDDETRQNRVPPVLPHDGTPTAARKSRHAARTSA